MIMMIKRRTRQPAVLTIRRRGCVTKSPGNGLTRCPDFESKQADIGVYYNVRLTVNWPKNK